MERWGALSVTDYKEADALAAEVLLYDRLIVPEPQLGHRNEWKDRGWDPDALETRLQQLGDDIAYRAIWSDTLRADWGQMWEEFQKLSLDAKELSEKKSKEAALEFTRRILAMNRPLELPDDGVRPEVLAVYRSRDEVQLPIRGSMNPIDAAGYVVGVRLVVPNDLDPEDALRRSIDLTRDATFRKRRRALLKWQRDRLDKWLRANPDSVDANEIKDAVKELDDLVRDYNEAVSKNSKKSASK